MLTRSAPLVPVGRLGRFVRLVVPVIALPLAFAACGGTPASVTPATPIPPGVIALDAKEYAFTPATLTAPAGAVTFAIRNTGREPHEFEVLEGEQSLAKASAFGVGATGAMTVNLEAGEYTFACRLNGHNQLGMTGTLTVTGG